MPEDKKGKGRRILPISRRPFVQGLAAGAAVAALRLVRTPGLCRDWPAADTRDAYGERLRVDFRFLTLEFHWASFCSHGGEWFRAGTDPEMAGRSDTVTVAVTN